MKKLFFLTAILFLFSASFAQKDSTKTEKVKTGFSMGGVPVVAYDADTGFKYGGLVNLYHYGDGTNYPNYNHSLYMEWSRTTKGSGINRLTYDALTLIPKTRVTLDVAYLTEQALNFYGFNGYESFYNADFETTDHADYISRMYYRHSRKLFLTTLDFQGDITGKELRWLAGFAHYRATIGTVDIDRLNEGNTENLLPDTASLYDKYVNWGIIPADQATGGNVTYLKAGVVYDTRDNEANPNKGLWSEALILNAPEFLGNDYGYTKLLLTHRQYLTLIPDRLSFAYRLSYQTKIAGTMPFYMLPYAIDSKATRDGLGGSKNIRGVLRNRVVGDGVAFGNFELRSKFLKTVIFNQNFYLGLNAFLDMGTVTKPYELPVDINTLTSGQQNILNYNNEGVHISYGGGIRFVINSNFIIAVDYGMAAKKDDGTKGMYIGLNYLF
ncbi:MAG: outer membrane protein assembly factor [Bacteroidales bacterium]|nr:outer membrane protein assembly factor [Bacteroidales bacterium]